MSTFLAACAPAQSAPRFIRFRKSNADLLTKLRQRREDTGSGAPMTMGHRNISPSCRDTFHAPAGWLRMTDLFSLATLAEPAMLVLKGWLLLSIPVAGLVCWAFHNADPARESGLALRGRPLS